MPGFSVNVINLLASNLRDGYGNGFPVLKELIQNANDAKAKHMVFGRHRGWPEATHPLLRGPALWFWNDGLLEAGDAEGIASFAEDTRAGETEAIGKFGLGMKSVFHWCEAFFYVARAENGDLLSECINPWNSGGAGRPHADWDSNLTTEWEWIKTFLAESFPNAKDGSFLLWLPLRTHDHLNGIGAIIERFPGERQSTDLAFLIDNKLPYEIANVLTLLPRLGTVEYRADEASASFIVNRAGVAGHGDESCNLMLGQKDVPALPAVGRVTVKFAAQGAGEVLYAGIRDVGHQGDELRAPFSELRRSTFWPRTFARDKEWREFQAEDKSQPEGAVIISHRDGSFGHCSIEWAVFLPLGEETTQTVPIQNSSRHYRITLHGQFFIDGGRKKIHHYPTLIQAADDASPGDADALQKQWNQALAQQIVLPLLLPALHAYLGRHKHDEDETKRLVSAINSVPNRDGTAFISEYGAYVCAKHAWLRVLEHRGPRWKLLETIDERRLLPLPASANEREDPGRAWTVLPGLSKLESVTYFDSSAPRIARGVDQWTEEDLEKVLSEIAIDSLKSSTALSYLQYFLEQSGRHYRGSGRLQNVMIDVIRRTFLRIGLSGLRTSRSEVRKLIGFVLPTRRMFVGPSTSEDMLKRLWECATETLIVPGDLDWEVERGIARTSIEEVTIWLVSLVAAEFESPRTGDLLDLVGFLRKSLQDEEWATLLRRNRGLKVIGAHDPRQASKSAYSFEDLERVRGRGHLFGYSQGRTEEERLGRTKLLAAVLPEEQTKLIDSDTWRALFAEEHGPLPSSADGAAILNSLGLVCKALTPTLQTRVLLLQDVNDPGHHAVARRGLRYLLHADAAHFDDEQSPLWVARHGQPSAWEKLWRQVTRGRDQDWNVLSKELADSMPRSRWDFLGIKEIEPQAVLNELARVGVAAISSDEFTPVECEDILALVDERALWSSLPLHAFTNRVRGAVDANTYRDIGGAFPSELGEHIKLARESVDQLLLGKQRQWIRALDDRALINVVLSIENLSAHWRLILDAIDRIGGDPQDGSRALVTLRWLPLRSGGAIRPGDVLDIPELADDIQRLTAKAQYCFAGMGDLDDAVLAHAGFLKLRKLFSRGRAALPSLGLLLESVEGYEVGGISILDVAQLQRLMPVLEGLAELPAWDVVCKAARVHGLGMEGCINDLVPSLKKPLDDTRLVNVLNTLAKAATDDSLATEVFNLYLDLLRNDAARAGFLLPKILLQSMAGSWSEPDRLCYGAEGLAGSVILNERQARILTGIIVEAGTKPSVLANDLRPRAAAIDTQILAAPGTLENYFRSWRGFVRTELLGAVMALLGQRVRPLAVEALQTHSFDWLCSQLGWQVPRSNDPMRREWMEGLSAEQALDKLKIGVLEVKEATVTVTNLLGHPMEAPRAVHPETLIAGEPWWGDSQRVSLPLGRIDLAKHDSDELSRLLRRTAEYLLRKLYGQPRTNLEALWQTLEQSDQLEIAVARSLLLENLPFYLRQLGAHNRSENLKRALDAHAHARQRLVESECSTQSDESAVQTLREDVRIAQKFVASSLIGDSDAQSAVLDAVRQKLHDLQYDMQSIPFELFQNADDAAIELGRCEAYPAEDSIVPDAARILIVEVGEDNLRFMHWGRAINARGPAGMDGEARGWNRDLEKMLVLSSTDKLTPDLTGKFGLGFKSVFLACDHPRIVSAQMRVEIVAGVLPEPWRDSREAMERLNSHTADVRLRGTLIELDTSQGGEITSRAKLLGGILCVFGRAIRQIRFNDPIRSINHQWRAEIVCQDIELGKWRLDNGDLNDGLAFRNKEGVVFFCLGPEGFRTLPDTIPSVWVTAPTREEESLGFAFSTTFALDAGRGRLAGDADNNRDLAKALGKSLGVSLTRLYGRAESDWAGLRNSLRLSDGTSAPLFWATLWQTLCQGWQGRPIEAATQLGCDLSLQALKELTRHTRQVPTGLQAPYAQMISLDQVQWEIPREWIAKGALRDLFAWGRKRATFSLETSVSSEIAAVVRRLRERALPKLDFLSLLRALPGSAEKEVNSDDARSLEGLASLLWEEIPGTDRNDVELYMAKLRFKNSMGRWSDSRALLCGALGDKEEQLRSNFAPAEHVLGTDYDETASLFFKRCRPRYDADTAALIEWTRLAKTDEAQHGALRYLIEGELGAKVARQLRNICGGTWLEGVHQKSVIFSSWDPKDVDEVLRLLSLTITYQLLPVPSPALLFEEAALERLHQWWDWEGRDKYLDSYLSALYPGGEAPDLSRNYRGDFGRSDWMTLLALGAFQRLGRVRDSQNRGFVEMLQTKGWWRVFADVPPQDDPAAWIGVLEANAEGQIEDQVFELWMESFPSLFRLARWLPDYVELFESLSHQPPGPLLLTPIANSAFQGGGISAPPINRTLRMGQHLVIRELLRLKVITDAHAVAYAYTPSRQVIRLLAMLHVDIPPENATGIFGALKSALGAERATFKGDYDIPLRILASREGLALEVFGIDIQVEDAL